MHVKVAEAQYHALALYGLEKLALGPMGYGGLLGGLVGGVYGYTREPDDDHLGRRLVRTGLGVAGGGTLGAIAGGIYDGGKALKQFFRENAPQEIHVEVPPLARSSPGTEGPELPRLREVERALADKVRQARQQLTDHEPPSQAQVDRLEQQWQDPNHVFTF